MSSRDFSPAIVALVVAVSWIGELVHNAVELPQLTLLSPENSVVGFVSLLLFLLWWRLPQRRAASALLLGWGLLHLVGGATVSVIPFEFLPFFPEQTLTHYLSHAIYGVAQLPLVFVAYRQLTEG